MAYLMDISAGTFFLLAPHHTFGRLVSSVNTHLNNPYASKLHAAIEWNGRCWCIKHLGLNGTWVNQLPVAQGDSCELKVNDVIQMAELTHPGFKVLDLHAPADLLWPVNVVDLTKVPPIYLEQYHLLPSQQHPELAVYFYEPEQQWYVDFINAETESQSRVLSPTDTIDIAGTIWQLVRIQIYNATELRPQTVMSSPDVAFIFNLSLDEETTQLEILHGQQRYDLGVRTHHYLMAHLARQRAVDAANQLDQKSQGWVYTEQLAKDLGLDITHLNIQIFRARKQIADTLASVIDQQTLIERRGGKIRLGAKKFSVFKGDKLIATSHAQPQSASIG